MGWTLIADTEAQSTDGDSVATTGIDTTGANLIVVAIFNEDGTSELSDSVGGNNNAPWTALTARQDGTSLKRVQLYYKLGTLNVGAGHTFTASKLPGNQPFPSIAVQAWSGTTSVFFDAENGATQSSGQTLQTGSVSKDTGRSNAVYVTALNTATSQQQASIDSSFLESADLNESGTADAAKMAYKTANSASENPTWTAVSPATSRAAAIAVFTDSGPDTGRRFLLVR